MKRSLQILILIAASAFASHAFAMQPFSGYVDVSKLLNTCAACHGKHGRSKLGMYPNLGGQYPDYLEHALKAYRSGDRKNAIMNAQAKNLSDAQIEALAHYFASQPPVVYEPALN